MKISKSLSLLNVLHVDHGFRYLSYRYASRGSLGKYTYHKLYTTFSAPSGDVEKWYTYVRVHTPYRESDRERCTHTHTHAQQSHTHGEMNQFRAYLTSHLRFSYLLLIRLAQERPIHIVRGDTITVKYSHSISWKAFLR